MKIPIIYGYPRSGGTLVNRCLGSITGNLILSEVNPLGSVHPITEQAQQWLNLLKEDQLEGFTAQSYGKQIIFLATQAKESHHHLIIRDWTAANFIDNPTNDNILTPSLLLEQNLYLSHYGFTCLPIAIARGAADVYDSITRTFKHLNLSIEAFGENYLTYAQAVCDYPVFKYEEICQDPTTQIRLICETLEINYDPAFINKFHQFENCTGDNILKQSSRGGQLREIKLLPSNTESESYIIASNDENCRRADQLLGYE
ncbi:sulfotransferase family protein [Crocosphaera sp. UHCC 0190]|uniref:sulfotransferase family protein n=1 Tax=Crocosphaera sp. UHCC 0190 TaxID=3110246 RepID=UPI002B20C97C|nr:sulfotransferase family protein [Crocosphaera sp. UHCC 0190]MEA5510388.1 sulfotransferase family protein [Crocosphaera sp. UHCC 0190]